ncbi:MAG: VOC family protein [Leptolyngbya sp. SIO1E4]|nr:VOC family protein [Leptolyngbya sp. SIO1E4]
MPSYHLDHLVLTVQDIERTCLFYQQVLDIASVSFGAGRKALQLGQQKINLHTASQPFSPHARHPVPGSADLCLVTETPIPVLIERLHEHGVVILEGPVQRTGAQHTLLSIYIRDPDDNLIELANVMT